jgi:Phage protein Gp138 N-terminal domain
MSHGERTVDWVEALQLAIEGKLSEVWTALPAVVVSFDATRRTCVLQPTIKMHITDEHEGQQWVELPLLLDVLVQFPGGGGFVMTFPLAPGDEGLVVFSARCVDAWWERGDVQVQAEHRMHDLSDGFFIPTVRSLPNVEGDISSTDVELRAVDPAGPRVTLRPDDSVEVSSPGVVTVTAATINLNGVVVINGTPYLSHTHTDPQGGNTGGVVP